MAVPALSRLAAVLGRPPLHYGVVDHVVDGLGSVPSLTDTQPKEVVDDLFNCAVKKQTGVSLRYMLDFGTRPMEQQLIWGARFLRNELPIRLAHRAVELDSMPYGLSRRLPVVQVRDWYVQSFKELRSFPTVKDAADEAQFTSLLRKIHQRHVNVVPLMAKAVEEFRRELDSHVALDDVPEIHDFLDKFFLSRIGIRFLIGHHIALHSQVGGSYIGAIDTQCHPAVVVEQAAQDAQMLCQREYGTAPAIRMYGDKDLHFAYVPSHLHHMVFELVKNSLRAVQEHHMDTRIQKIPPVKLIVAEGQEDITIKVADEGGGIPRSNIKNIFTYLFSTARAPLPEMRAEVKDLPVVLAGYGCGLPIARLYARYFQGDLQVLSMDGYGTDAYLHLNRLGDGAEPLP